MISIIGIALLMAVAGPQLCRGQNVNPGMRGRITQRGLNYARDLALDILMSELEDINVPDLEGDVGVGEVTLTNIQTSSLPRPEASIVPLPGVGLRWSSSDLNPTINGDYRVRIKLFNIRKRGTVTATGRGMYFRLDFVIGVDDEGRLSTYDVRCNAGGDIRLSFSGGWSDVLNLGSDVFKSEIRQIIHAQICSAAKDEIQKKLKMELQTFPVSEEVADLYELDFSMTQFPAFEEDYVEAHHKGTLYLASDPREPSFFPSIIPAFPEHTDYMLYFYFTDYVINSGLESAFIGGNLAIDLRSVWQMVPETGDVPGNLSHYMRTSCPLSLCVGTVFPQLEELYPRGHAILNVYANKAPRVSVYGKRVHLEASGNVDLLVDNTGDPAFVNTTTVQPGFSVNMTIHAEVALRVNNTKLYFELLDIEPVADVLQSSVGDIGNGFFFETLIRVGTQAFLVPKMQELAAKGINLPKIKDVDFINPTIIDTGTPNIMVVATDIVFTP